MTKPELPCSVITDLLPLYQDGLCSPDSRELVEAHLSTCENCRRLCSELPLPELRTAAVPDEAEAFLRVRKKIRRGKLLKAVSICAAMLLIAFAVLNCIWFPAKYIPYKKLCRGFSHAPDDGKGIQFQTESGDYAFRVKMPAYLSFSGGFLSVQPISQQQTEESNIVLFIWPQTGGETRFGVMVMQQQTAQLAALSQFYISSDLRYLDELNASQEQMQKNKALYEAHLDEVRGMMDAARTQWSGLFPQN